MPRPKQPPTPSSSTDIRAADKIDLEAAFALPPPAMPQQQQPPASRSGQTTPPVSPKDRRFTTGTCQKRTLSGAMKSKECLDTAQYSLPPPPSRPRKIIQMKPKSPSACPSGLRQEPSSPSTTPAKTAQATTPKTSSSSNSVAGPKRKNPSATSAAGRKIARKTAHSIIEQRRRSKMNEEFGVLKSMIPACEGVEMHKLAILQAGIEYLNYLHRCIRQLEAGSQHIQEDDLDNICTTGFMQENVGDDESQDQEEEQETPDTDAKELRADSPPTDPQYRKPRTPTASSWSDSRPNTIPQSGPQQSTIRPVLPSISSFSASHVSTAATLSETQASIPLSPALNAVHFSPDLARIRTNSTTTSFGRLNASPSILPLPEAMLAPENNRDSPVMSEGGIEATATATAALMMLSHDRRCVNELSANSHVKEQQRGKGMSVKDLLSS